MKNIVLLAIASISVNLASAQEKFTRKDSLQGGLRLERTCYDVLRYDLNIKINIDEKSIVGFNEITFKIVEKSKKIQLDLFQNMKIDSIIWNKNTLQYTRDNNAVFIPNY